MGGAWERFTARMEALTRAAAGSGRRPLVPEGGADLWRLFVALCNGRQGTCYGPLPLTLAEIEAGARLYRLALRPHHVAVVQAMDRAWLAAAVRSAAPEGTKTAPHVSTGQLTPALFDICT